MQPVTGDCVVADLSAVRVLIADDNPHMADLLRPIMGAAGFRNLRVVHSASEANALLQREPIDLLLTDLLMPPVDGVELTRWIRWRDDSPNPYLPVVVVTAHSARATVLKARDAGASVIVAKPIAIARLFKALNDVILRPRPFVRTPDYRGPDRRRLQRAFAGPDRRQVDVSPRARRAG